MKSYLAAFQLGYVTEKYYVRICHDNLYNKRKMRTLTSFPFNKENPFADPDIENLGPSIIHELENNDELENLSMTAKLNSKKQLTGHSAYIKKVYVNKEYFQNIVLKEFMQFFKLKPITVKVLRLILNITSPSLSEFTLNIKTIMIEVGCSQVSAIRALAELCFYRIIARGHSETHYYINPICNKCTNSVTFSISYVSE